MELDFNTAFKQLNKQQLRAVEKIDGPVLVIAGPGTGKTQLLSLRVANILTKTDTDANSILCLTFTNFAATNMRDRLHKLIGNSSRRVNVKTFHSFAADIMSLYPEYFWNGAHLTIAPDSFQIDVIQNILSKLPISNPLSSMFAGKYTALNDVQQALRLSKDAGLTPGKLRAMIEVNIAYLDVIETRLTELTKTPLGINKLDELLVAIEELPDQNIDEDITPLMSLSSVIKNSLHTAVSQDKETGKTTQTGKWKRKWVQTVNGKRGMYDERRRNQWWLAFSDFYQQYRDGIHGNGFYDYSDMLVEVISQLEQQPELRASVQEKFLYILIDEFQDTNAAQMRLAHLVATNPTTEASPNLMAVGDDDQSIFAFNGAELNNMLSFKKTYTDTEIIVLSDNYRSSQQLLNKAQQIIEQADDRVVKREPELSKNLIANRQIDSEAIEHITYPTREHQFSSVAQSISLRWQKNKKETIAVLARNHASLREISSILSHLNIPIKYELQNDVMQNPAIQQIALLAELTEAIQKGNQQAVNSLVSKLILHPMWSIPGPKIWELAIGNYRDTDWLKSLEESEKTELASIGQWLSWLASEASHQPLRVLIEYYIGLNTGKFLTSPLKNYYLLPKEINQDYLNTLSAVNTLLSLVEEFSSSDTPSLHDFNRYITLNRELERPIVDQSWYVSGEDSVQLMTVHKAKGLEFDTVYLIDCTESNWQPRRISRQPPANLPLQPYGEASDDYVRLLYVAVTRAKRNFIATSYLRDNKGTDILATPLITNVLPSVNEKELHEPVVVLENAVGWPRLKNTTEAALLKDRIEQYQLSPSGFCTFLDVTNGGPESFMLRHLLRIPEAQSMHMAYGTAMHSALQTAQRLTNQQSFKLSEVLLAYHTSLQEQALDKQNIERLSTHGQEVLNALFDNMAFSLPKGGKAEVNLTATLDNNINICGRLDNIHETDEEIIITDYKTGGSLGSFATRDQTKMIKAWRHKMQLEFYALLVRESELYPSHKSIKTRMAYIEADRKELIYLEHVPSEEELEQVLKLITAVSIHIREFDFPVVEKYPLTIEGIRNFENDLIAQTI